MKIKTQVAFLPKAIKYLFTIWILSIVVFAVLVYVSPDQQVNDDPVGKTIMIDVLIGSLAFVFLLFAAVIKSVLEAGLLTFKKSPGGAIVFGFKFLAIMAVLPLFLLWKIFKDNKKQIVGRIIQTVLVLTLLLPPWVLGYFVAGSIGAEQLGYIPQDLNIVGTGSMYPTWPKGEKGKSPKELSKEVVSTAGFLPYPNGVVVGDKRILGHTLERGDIITWENDATRALTSQDGSEPAGLLKRLIGLPGDTIELRDGIVYLNGEPQKEPFVAKARSTFGEKFLKECQAVTVPPNEVFAMGDNRKGSADSREIGFAPIKYIGYVLPLAKQKGKLDKNWHDASNDLGDSAKPKIDKAKFVELLNEKRKEKNGPPLNYQPKLDRSAFLRGQAILKNNDFEQKYYTMEKSMADAGYWNTYWWEVTIQGYYEAEEIIEDYLERDWTEAKETWFDKKFDDIGISEVGGTLNGCPTQVIVIHIAGYIPPDYSKADIESWKVSLTNLKEIQLGWANLKGYQEFYEKNKQDVDRINEIISIRIANISVIVAKMEANQWLSVAEQKMVDQDQVLYKEQDSLATKLNSL